MEPIDVIPYLMAIIGFMATAFLGFIWAELTKSRQSIEKLNISMAKILGEIEHHDKRISFLEGRTDP